MLLAFDFLIDVGPQQLHFAVVNLKDEVTFCINTHVFCALEGQFDLIWICAGRDDQVVFELSLVAAVVREIDAGINVLVLDLFIRRNIRAPFRGIIADEVVDDAGEPLQARDGRVSLRAFQAHAEDCPLTLTLSLCGARG